MQRMSGLASQEYPSGAGAKLTSLALGGLKCDHLAFSRSKVRAFLGGPGVAMNDARVGTL